MLKKLRKQAGLTQFELAVKSGVDLGTIRNWEQKGIRSAKVGLVKLVADALGCMVDDLL